VIRRKRENQAVTELAKQQRAVRAFRNAGQPPTGLAPEKTFPFAGLGPRLESLEERRAARRATLRD